MIPKTVLAALMVAMSGAACWAWDATAHEWISGIGIEKLLKSMPDFVRAPDAVQRLPC